VPLRPSKKRMSYSSRYHAPHVRFSAAVWTQKVAAAEVNQPISKRRLPVLLTLTTRTCA
jgi:hypothetical protein